MTSSNLGKIDPQRLASLGLGKLWRWPKERQVSKFDESYLGLIGLEVPSKADEKGTDAFSECFGRSRQWQDKNRMSFACLW